MIKNLNEILEKHLKWLNDENGGERANLSGTNLSGANLSGADLSGADLSRANLSGADLSGADLRIADLSGADLSRTNLSGTNLSGTCLRGADLRIADLSRTCLRGANLSGTNLSEACLRGADLYIADLSGADLRIADLSGADLSRANLSGTNLSRANLRGANLSGTEIELTLLNKFYPICCPEAGSFVGWKKVRGDLIVKLEVTENAKRSSAFGRKCRCNEAKVLDIQNLDGTSADVTEVYSKHDANFAYRVGETVRVDNFDEDRRNECAPGIHFFITRQEAVDY